MKNTTYIIGIDSKENAASFVWKKGFNPFFYDNNFRKNKTDLEVTKEKITQLLKCENLCVLNNYKEDKDWNTIVSLAKMLEIKIFYENEFEVERLSFTNC